MALDEDHRAPEVGGAEEMIGELLFLIAQAIPKLLSRLRALNTERRDHFLGLGGGGPGKPGKARKRTGNAASENEERDGIFHMRAAEQGTYR